MRLPMLKSKPTRGFRTVANSATLPTPPPVGRLAWRRRASTAQDAGLVVLCSLFFYVHARHVLVDGVITSLPFAVEQGMLIGIFLARRKSIATSTRPFDWIVATGGGWLPLALQVQDGGGTAGFVGFAIQMVGLTLSLTCFGFLGKSFGIVAAHRGLKTTGPYRVVRHPIYLAHTITTTGFLVANWHPITMAMVLVITSCQLLRIHAEERVLVESADYASYRERVPWRLVPGVY